MTAVATPAAAPATATPATSQAAPASPAVAATPPTGTEPTGAASGAEAPATEAAPSAAETKEEKLARLSRAGKSARAAAARNRELMAQNQRLNADAQRAMQQGQNAEQQMARLKQLAQTDKMALVRELGLSAREIIEAGAKEGTPEAAMEARIKAAEERAAKAEERAMRWEQQQQAAQQQQYQATAHEKFFTDSGDATSYPNVSKMPKPARLAWAQQLLSEDRAAAQRAGYDMSQYAPTNKQLLAHMEKLAAAGVPASASQAPSAAAPDAKQAGSTTPQTVSNAVVSAKYTLPANFDALPDREQKKHLAEYLRSLGGGKRKR